MIQPLFMENHTNKIWTVRIVRMLFDIVNVLRRKKPQNFTRLTQKDDNTYKILVMCHILHSLTPLLLWGDGNRERESLH